MPHKNKKEVSVKFAVKMGTGVMMCIPSFVKIGSAIHKLIQGIHKHTEHDDHIRLLLFFQNMESRILLVFTSHLGLYRK
jgi:hypothetical protein